MCLHVSSQVRSVSKCFPTVSTPKRLVPCVGPEVTLEKPGARKCFPTHLALVVQAVGEDMHGECWHTHIHLATHMTLLGCAGVKSSVCLLVSGQVAASCIIFTTFIAPILWLEQIIAKHFIL